MNDEFIIIPKSQVLSGKKQQLQKYKTATLAFV